MGCFALVQVIAKGLTFAASWLISRLRQACG
jgi:hypothetical protein